MDNRVYISQSLVKRKWLRLSASIILALILASLVLFIPITASTTVIQVPVSNLSDTGTIDLPLPLGANIVYAAGGLTITKKALPAPSVNQGEILTYTLIITNDTGQDITDVIVTDTVPANTQCIGASMAASTPNWAVFPALCEAPTTRLARWGLLSAFGDTLPAGQSAVLTYAVTVAAPLIDQSLIENISYGVVATNTAQTQTFSDIGTIYTTIVNAPEWQITKSVVPSPTVEPGNPLTYTLTITNSGHLTTTGSYTVTDELPAYTNYVVGSASPAATFDGSSLIWVLSNPVGINESFTTTFVVTVTRPLTDGTSLINQTYHITGGNVFSQAFGAPLPVTVFAPVTMTITKSDDPYDPVEAGALLTYTLTITNDSSSKGHADNVVVTDTLPANTSLVDAGFISPTDGATATNGSVITWTITNPDPLLVGQTAELTLTVRVRSPLTNGTILTNSYGVSATNALASATGPAVTTTVVSTPTLEIFKQGLPEPVGAGDLLTYTIRYTNTGNANATGVIITDIFPISTSFASATPSGSSILSGGGRQWTIGPVAGDGGGGVITLTLNVLSPQADGTVLTDVVTITANEPTSDTYTATNTIVSTPTLEIFKQGLPEPVAAGGLLTYTIRYTNTGNADATGVVITDIFPSGTSFNDATPLGNDYLLGAGRLWNIPDVPGDNGGGVITLTLNVDSPQDNGTVLTDVVTITANEPTSDTYTATNTIVSTPTLEIFKQGLPEPVAAGGLLTYTIRYTNTGNADATGVVITDIFPSGTSFNDATPLGNDYLLGAGRLWNIPTVPGDNGGGIITLTLNVDSPQAAGTVLTDVVTITANEPTSDSYTATNTITSTPILNISKVESADPIRAGSVLTYTITYTNTGNADATGVVITDTYEGDFDSITATPPATVLVSPLPARVVWNIGSVPADGLPRSRVVTVTLPTSLAEGTILTNSVTITSDQGIVDSDTITTEVRALQADLQANKVRQGSGDVLAGDLITYTITITNGTGSDTVDALITDTFPVGSVQSVVSCDGCTANVPSGVLTWTVTSFAPAAPQTFTVVLRTSPTYSNPLTNTVEISFTTDFLGSIDPDDTNNSDQTIDTVRFPRADLQANKVRQGSGDVIAGDLITYTITITNGAGSDTVDALITDTFPVGSVQSVVSCDGCTADVPSGVLTWTVTDFAPDAPQTFSVVLRTSPTYSNPLTNTVEISFTSADPNGIDPDPTNNSGQTIDTVRFREADLQANKVRQGSGDVIAGDLITYTITITNGIGSDTVSVLVTDTFPVGSVQAVVSCSGCTTNLGLGQLTWTIADFAAGNTQLLTVVLRTSPTYAGLLTNTVEIGFTSTDPNGVDPDPTNNSDQTIDTVRFREADLSITKARVGSGPVFVGEPITFTLTVNNAGPDMVTAVVTDTFNNAQLLTYTTTYPGASCTGAVGGLGPIECTLPNFIGSTVITVVLDTSNSTPSPPTVLNIAQIGSVEGAQDPDTDDTTSAALPPVTVLGVAELSITKTANPASGQTVRPGQTIIYNLQVTNLSTATAAATNVFLTDTLPLPSVGIVNVTTNGTDLGLSGNDYRFSIGNLGIGASLNATIEVTVTAATAGTILNNSAIASSAETGSIGPVMTTHRVVTDTATVFLPIVLKDFIPPSPFDLTVRNVVVPDSTPETGDSVEITITLHNTGTAFVTPFWVDLYLATTPIALTVNQTWEDNNGNGNPDDDDTIVPYGVAWKVGGMPADGDKVITNLNPNDLTETGCRTNNYSNFIPYGLECWPQTWKGIPLNNYFRDAGIYYLYVQVDSLDDVPPTGGSNGIILEDNESNNLFGPFTITVSGQSLSTAAPSSAQEPQIFTGDGRQIVRP